ncbi:MAG: ketopantoate reductase family protein [Promethearchaeota archaeon]
MKILVYGAGVLGSLYAAKLYEAGEEVYLLARGKRLEDIRHYGVIIDHFLQKNRTEHKIPTIEQLKPEDYYDLIIVLMRKNQVASILPILSQNKLFKTVIFMGNNGKGAGDYIEAVGEERVLLGFPAAGGRREGSAIKVVYREDTKITLGELDGSFSPRLKELKEMFEKAEIPVDISPNIDSWLKYHIALVSPLANGIYLANGDNYALAKNPEALKLIVNAIREGFKVLISLNYPIEPKRLKRFNWMPNFVLVRLLKKIIGSEMGELSLRDHAMAAKDEMKEIADEFQLLIQQSGLVTPSISELYQYI